MLGIQNNTVLTLFFSNKQYFIKHHQIQGLLYKNYKKWIIKIGS